jgi:AraC family transcriptional regulator
MHLTPEHTYTSRIYRALEFIDTHLSEPLNLESLAQEAYFSPYHFHRIFTARLGETPKAFVNRLRVEKAASLLLNNPTLTMTDIALLAGFSSSATFARSFKQYFQLSASELKAAYTSWIKNTDAVNHKIYQGFLNNIRIQHLPKFHVAYVANLCDGYRQQKTEGAWAILNKWASARALLTPEATRIGLCYDYSLITPLHRCRYYACITVPEQIPADELVGIMDIPGGKYAVYRFEGPPEKIKPTYEALTAIWVARSGYQRSYLPPIRHAYEILRVSPDVHPEGLLALDIYLPILPR